MSSWYSCSCQDLPCLTCCRAALASLTWASLMSGFSVSAQYPISSVSAVAASGKPSGFEALDLCLESGDVLVHLGNLHFHVTQITPMLSSQCLQLLILDLVHGLGLSPPAVGSVFTLGFAIMPSREWLLSIDRIMDVSETWDYSSQISSSYNCFKKAIPLVSPSRWDSSSTLFM